MLSLSSLYGIKYASPLPLSLCRINKKYLLDRAGIGEDGSVLLFLMPYYTSAASCGNVSMYAAAEDYHIFFRRLTDDLLPRLRAERDLAVFAAYADHSPISEMYGAALSGLGVLGKNELLINAEYSSFCFIGGIYSDIPYTEWTHIVSEASVPEKYEVKGCFDCGRCAEACPAGCIGGDRSHCRSYITQKKRLDAGEDEIIKNSRYVWGCDICQNVCPYTKAAAKAGTLETPIDFFRENLIPELSLEVLDGLLADGKFESRAFSWRGEDTIRRNLKIKEGCYELDT
ncbi:MAG: hypothetical protein LUH54_01395 [Firmicutes bacterium]|nr:hypothetical protein [Bacillota bacterium]